MRHPNFLYSKVLACLALVLAVGQTGLLAHDDHEHPHPKAVPAAETYKPSAVPDRIVLSWVDDPATSQAVTWRTDTTVMTPVAEIAIAEDGPLFLGKETQIKATSQDLKTNLGEARFHTANFKQLLPDHKYVYRVGDGTNWSEWTHFRTASREPRPFTFIYMGDAQNDVKSLWSRVVREAFGDAPKAAFLLHAGDLINLANNDEEWGEWFYATGFIHRMIPCIATPGNHEYHGVIDFAGKPAELKLSGHWRPTFAFPENGPPGLEETAYWLDYQGTRILSLNSNESLDVQTEWLESVLADNPNRWTIVTFHHPVYSSAAGRDNPEVRARWQPLFDKYRVDLVLQGHDHTYSRTGLMAQGEENVPSGVTKRSPDAGTVYVVSVSGPKMYPLEGGRPFVRRSAEDTQLYQIITVDTDELRYEAKTATGRLYDAFTLKKRAGELNELIDQIPDSPENRRSESSEPKLSRGSRNK